MTKPLDPDLKALRACVRALDESSSPKALRANMEYLWSRFVGPLPVPLTWVVKDDGSMELLTPPTPPILEWSAEVKARMASDG